MVRITPRPPPTQALALSCLNQRCPVCVGPLWSGDILLARSLLASGREDLSALLRTALLGLEDVPVVGVISDGQQAIRQAVAEVLPGIPHQLCQFHDLREAGRPIWEADRHAQKELRKRMRGMRPIERAVEDRTDPEVEVIRGSCAAVRGALGDSGKRFPRRACKRWPPSLPR